MTKIAIGSDHGGFEYKSKIIDYLKVTTLNMKIWELTTQILATIQ